jgi:hypothetical protein
MEGDGGESIIDTAKEMNITAQNFRSHKIVMLFIHLYAKHAQSRSYFITEEWGGSSNIYKKSIWYLPKNNQYDILLWHISNGLQGIMGADWHSSNRSFILCKHTFRSIGNTENLGYYGGLYPGASWIPTIGKEV